MGAKQGYTGSQKIKGRIKKSSNEEMCTEVGLHLQSCKTQNRSIRNDTYKKNIFKKCPKGPINAIIVQNTANNTPTDSGSSPRYSFSTTIPEKYNETYITAIPKDPNWLYVYWEFSEDTLKQIDLLAESIGSKLVLRIKDFETNDIFENVLPFPIEITKGKNNQYLKIPEVCDGKDYQIECGRLSDKGDFLLIVQSNPVFIPPIEPEPQLMHIDFEDSEEILSSKNQGGNQNQINSLIPEICRALSSQYYDSAQKP